MVEGIPEEGATPEVVAVSEVVETVVEVEETAGNAVDLREVEIGMMAKVARRSLDQVIVVEVKAEDVGVLAVAGTAVVHGVAETAAGHGVAGTVVVQGVAGTVVGHVVEVVSAAEAVGEIGGEVAAEGVVIEGLLKSLRERLNGTDSDCIFNLELFKMIFSMPQN